MDGYGRNRRIGVGFDFEDTTGDFLHIGSEMDITTSHALPLTTLRLVFKLYGLVFPMEATDLQLSII